MPENYATIQEAMDAAVPGDTVFVAPGTYSDVNEFELAPGWTFEAVVIMKPGVTLLGRPGAPETVSIQAADSMLGIACLEGDSSTVVAGITVTGGQVGLMGRLSSPTIHHCRFVGNGVAEGSNAGGGLYGDYFSPTIRDCEFLDNTTNSGAGATFANESWPRLERCDFRGNRALASPWIPASGGALAISNDSGALLIDCDFTDNAADSLGGAVRIYEAEVEFVGCTFSGNASGGDGGAVWFNYGADVVMRECTLSGNTAAARGGAFYFRSETSLLATDCLFASNAAAQGADGFLEDGYAMSVELICCGAEAENWAGDPVVIDDSDCD